MARLTLVKLWKRSQPSHSCSSSERCSPSRPAPTCSSRPRWPTHSAPPRSSSTIGAALLIALAAVLGTLGALGTIDDVAAWHLLGGLGSAIYITAGILLFPRLGAVLTVGLFIAGQMVVSLALDTSGWLGVDRSRSARRSPAPAVTAGAALIARSQAAPARPAGSALGLAAGAALPLQGAVNAQLRADLDAPVTAGAWSFVVAAAAMVAVLALVRAMRASTGSAASRGGAGSAACAAPPTSRRCSC